MPNAYEPPRSVDELMHRYAQGERTFPDTELSDANLSGMNLDGAQFTPYSWFFNASFTGASLKDVSFRECNVKCADFSGANLTDASFELAAIDAATFRNAATSGAKFAGATYYGITLTEEDLFP